MGLEIGIGAQAALGPLAWPDQELGQSGEHIKTTLDCPRPERLEVGMGPGEQLDGQQNARQCRLVRQGHEHVLFLRDAKADQPSTADPFAVQLLQRFGSPRGELVVSEAMISCEIVEEGDAAPARGVGRLRLAGQRRDGAGG